MAHLFVPALPVNGSGQARLESGLIVAGKLVWWTLPLLPVMAIIYVKWLAPINRPPPPIAMDLVAILVATPRQPNPILRTPGDILWPLLQITLPLSKPQLAGCLLKLLLHVRNLLLQWLPPQTDRLTQL